MEYCRGGTLEDARAARPFGEQEALVALVQMLRAVTEGARALGYSLSF